MVRYSTHPAIAMAPSSLPLAKGDHGEPTQKGSLHEWTDKEEKEKVRAKVRDEMGEK